MSLMKIHIVNPYGTLPDEGWRKYRTNIAAEELAKRGHDVILWISNIDHRSKKTRSANLKEFEIAPNFRIIVVPSTPYNGNASIGRVKYERSFAKSVVLEFNKNNFDADCVIITDPCLFYGRIIYKIVQKSKAKFVIDILDLWPEVFVVLLPKVVRKFSKFALSYFYSLRKKLYLKADGIIAVTQDYLDIAISDIGDKLAKVVYIGIDLDDVLVSKNLTNFQDVKKEEGEKWVVYAGTLGINYDIRNILKLGLELEKDAMLIKLIIAGDGPMNNEVIEFISAHKLTKTIYVGRLNLSEINNLFSLSDVALSTYLEGSTVSLPVKAFDYIAYGIPVVNSLGRELASIISTHNIGLNYKAEDFSDLYTKVSQLLSDDLSRIEMKDNALKLSQDFDLKVQYSKYCDFIEEICCKQKY